MLRFAETVCRGLMVWLALCGVVHAQEDVPREQDAPALKQAAVSRLASSMDPAVPVAVGKAVVRQAALVRARELLVNYGRRTELDEGWMIAAPEWQAAEADLMQGALALIENGIQNPEWFYEVLNREIANILDAEEADYIATHFTTAVGQEQRILLQMRLVAEVLMANYTFTGRIDHTIPGLDGDLAELSVAYWDLEPFRKRDFMKDPQAIKFAGQAAGLKFTRMLAIHGIEGFIAHIDAVAAAARGAVDDAEPVIERYALKYQRRTGKAK